MFESTKKYALFKLKIGISLLLLGYSVLCVAVDINITPKNVNKICPGSICKLSGDGVINYTSQMSYDLTFSNDVEGSNILTAYSSNKSNNDAYKFRFINNINKWVRLDAPQRNYNFSNIVNNQLPKQTAPLMRFVSNNSTNDRVYLPVKYKLSDKLVFINNNTNGLSYDVYDKTTKLRTMAPGDTVRFVANRVDNQVKWEKQTVIVTLLAVYSEDAITYKKSEAAVQQWFLEALNQTNAALEKSEANVYIKLASFFKHSVSLAGSSPTMGNVLDSVISDSDILDKRKNSVKADVVIYMGTESISNQPKAAGLTYINPPPGKAHIVVTAKAPVQTMRHELGHIFGIDHCPKYKNGYVYGYDKVPDIMCPYDKNGRKGPKDHYSNPNLYTDAGEAMGDPLYADATRRINERAKAVSAYY